MTPPTLTTDRLTLRAPARPDFEAYAGIMMSDRAEFMLGALSRQSAWNHFASDVASWIIDGFGYWTAETSDHTPVAFVGITKPAVYPEHELGWMVPADAEGKGYAREAAQAARDWAKAQNLPSLVSYVDKRNTRSRALAERIGATADHTATRPEGENSEDTLVYRHWGQAA